MRLHESLHASHYVSSHCLCFLFLQLPLGKKPFAVPLLLSRWIWCHPPLVEAEERDIDLLAEMPERLKYKLREADSVSMQSRKWDPT